MMLALPQHRLGTAIALVLLGTALAGAPTAAANAAAKTHTVVIDGTAFAPPVVRVHRGDRVVWVNRDPFPHTATAKDHSFDSRAIPAGGSWSRVASKAGTFEYICTFHPTMTGTLVVE
jgi:plastocyanin